MQWFWTSKAAQYRHNEVVRALHQLQEGIEQIMADLSAIQAEVTNETTVVASVVKLVNSLADQITAAGTDPVALQSIVDTMRANDTALADAVTAHTPAVVPAPVPAAQAATNPDGSPVELHPSQGGNPNSTPAT